jgi:phage-related protein
MRQLSNDIIAEKNRLASTNPWVWLLELRVNEAERIYLCSDNAPVIFADSGGTDREWRPFPFLIGDKREEGDGNLSSLTIAVSNISGEMSRMMEVNRGFIGRIVILALVCKISGVPAIAYRETFRIQNQSETEQAATFTLGNENLFRFVFPAARFFRSRCRWMYKASLCQYAGALATCDKTLRGGNGCEAHGADSAVHPRRYGGFPGIPRA